MSYRPLATDAGSIHLCGHRGHSVGAPENTLPSLEAAARLGADACEIDVVLTRDDEIVVLHDELLDRTTNGKGFVCDLSLAEVRRLDAGRWFGPQFEGTRIPTLSEALATAGRLGLALNVEIKERRRTDRLIDRLGDVLANAAMMKDIIVISFDHPSLVRAQQRIPGLRTELITHARHVDPVAMAERAGAASVAIEWDMFHPADAEKLHGAGIAVRVTVPKPARISLLEDYGVRVLDDVVSVLADGAIDILAGDDVGQIVGLVRRLGPA
jgi:glycerophosphoryl diester phosphodiesterase